MKRMSYAAAVDQLYALGQELAPASASAPRRRFDLAHMRVLMASMGDPQQSFASVLIAGTNGKGSTAATLAAILASAGYRTGLYTSPHLVRVNERIQLSVPTLTTEYASTDAPISAGPATLLPISDEDFARHYFEVDETARRLVANGSLPQAPSFFEMLTALGFGYFAERRAEIVVLEVGLGGRLDATNIVDPLLSVITDIALDHQDYLGSTIAEIAREKAGILRAGGTLVTLPQHPEANRVFGEVAAGLEDLRAVSAASYMPSAFGGELPGARLADRLRMSEACGDSRRDAVLPRNDYAVTLDEREVRVCSPLRGQHQQRNLALALASVSELRNRHGYKINDEAVERGVRETLWPGRLQLMTLGDGLMLLLDVAHNPAGAWTLRSALSELAPERPRTLLFSCLRDKDLGEMTQILFPLFDSSSGEPERRGDHVVLAPMENARAVEVKDLAAAAEALGVPAHAAPHVPGAFALARGVTPEGGLIVATGSVYLVGEILRLAEDLAWT